MSGTSGLLPAARKADSLVTAFCDGVLEVPPVERVMVGKRLLHTSREALKRIFWLSYTYRVHGGEAYARRAVEEMLAVSRFSDWNPAHFLDVGEMALGVAIGYDWLQGSMSPEEKAAVASALRTKGLEAALDEGAAWFYRSPINWNAVCNAGMAYAALALWETDPDFCGEMLRKTLESNPLALEAYSPEGGYPEGYNYWGYGTSFQVMLDAALESAFPVPVYTPDRTAFYRSARFMQFLSTPAGRCYNFSDCEPDARMQYMQAWMALRTGDNSLLYPELHLLEAGKTPAEERLFPMFILAMESLEGPVRPPREQVFTCGGTTPVFIYREGWEDPGDDYLAVKGGLSMSSHSHCDQGSFFFESDGVAWAADLGMQDYNSLESVGLDLWDMTQDGERWDVFRIGPFSHNILTVNGHKPKVNHPVAIARTWDGRRKGAALDLTEVYSEDLVSCRREVWLENGDLHVVDHVEAGEAPCSVRWALCTEAAVCTETAVCTEAAVLPETGPGHSATDFILVSGDHRRSLRAEVRLRKNVARLRKAGGSPAPVLTPGVWPTTYDPARPLADGMQYLHPTDAPNPGATLLGYTFTLQPHQKATLRVVLAK